MSIKEINSRIWDNAEEVSNYVSKADNLLNLLSNNYFRWDGISDDEDLLIKHKESYKDMQTLVDTVWDYVGFLRGSTDKIFVLLQEAKRQA